MVADLIFAYAPGRIQGVMRRLKTPRNVRVSDIRFEVYEILAERVKDGQAGWPVVTGNSLLGFYGQPDGLYNSEEYAKYVEGRFNHIRSYAESAIVPIVREALNLIGVGVGQRPRGRRGERRDFNFFVRELQRIAALTRPLE